MNYNESLSIFTSIYHNLLIEEISYINDLELNENDIQWLLGLNEAKKELSSKAKEKVNKLLKVALKRKDNLSFGPLFKDERTYVNLNEKVKEEDKDLLNVPKDISDFLAEKGYEVDDYKVGLAKNKDNPNRKIKIGKLIKDAKLKKVFDERLKGQVKSSTDLMVVFTHNPKDIAMMSTGRGWTSCANLELTRGNPAAKQIPGKIKYGGMVAYLISKSDKEIENPVGRISIRRLVDKETGAFILLPEKVCYGSGSKLFKNIVKDTLNKSNKETNQETFSIFKDAEGGYSDTFDWDNTEARFNNKPIDIMSAYKKKKYKEVFSENLLRIFRDSSVHERYQVLNTIIDKKDKISLKQLIDGDVQFSNEQVDMLLKGKLKTYYIDIFSEKINLSDEQKKMISSKSKMINTFFNFVNKKDTNSIGSLIKVNKIVNFLNYKSLFPHGMSVLESKSKLIKNNDKLFFDSIEELLDERDLNDFWVDMFWGLDHKSFIDSIKNKIFTLDRLKTGVLKTDPVYNLIMDLIEEGEIERLYSLLKYKLIPESSITANAIDTFLQVYDEMEDDNVGGSSVRKNFLNWILDNVNTKKFIKGFNMTMVDEPIESTSIIKTIFERLGEHFDYKKIFKRYREFGYDNDTPVYKLIKRYKNNSK